MKPLERTFEAMNREEPRQALRLRILAQIQLLEERQMYRQKWFSLGMLSLSAVVFFGGMYQYGLVLLQSDFWTLLSLLFSDLGILVGSFQDFAYSLLETLPLVPLLVLLAPVVLFFWSMSLFLALSEKKGHGVFAGAAAVR